MSLLETGANPAFTAQIHSSRSSSPGLPKGVPVPWQPEVSCESVIAHHSSHLVSFSRVDHGGLECDKGMEGETSKTEAISFTSPEIYTRNLILLQFTSICFVSVYAIYNS